MGKHLSRTFALVMACALSSNALAQATYPEKPITLVVPFTPGSGSDIVARIIAKGLTETIKATVVIDNKPGANGSLGAQAVARAKPDGYTLLLGSATTNAVNYAFFPSKLGYEPSSFDFISGLGASDVSMYIPSDQPWKNINELIAQAKKSPGKLSCGSGNAVTAMQRQQQGQLLGLVVVDWEHGGVGHGRRHQGRGQLSIDLSVLGCRCNGLCGARLRQSQKPRQGDD